MVFMCFSADQYLLKLASAEKYATRPNKFNLTRNCPRRTDSLDSSTIKETSSRAEDRGEDARGLFVRGNPKKNGNQEAIQTRTNIHLWCHHQEQRLVGALSYVLEEDPTFRRNVRNEESV